MRFGLTLSASEWWDIASAGNFGGRSGRDARVAGKKGSFTYPVMIDISETVRALTS